MPQFSVYRNKLRIGILLFSTLKIVLANVKLIGFPNSEESHEFLKKIQVPRKM